MSNINLLPKNIKDNIAQSKENKKALRHLLKSFFWIIAIIIIIVICSTYYKFQIAGINDLVDRKKDSIKQYSSVEIESSELSERLKTISRIDKNLNSWPEVINEVQQSMPKGAFLSSLKIDADKKKRCEISGVADSKSTVASLRNLLEESDKFEFVDIEKSVTTEVQDIDGDVEVFTLTFSLKEGALNE